MVKHLITLATVGVAAMAGSVRAGSLGGFENPVVTGADGGYAYNSDIPVPGHNDLIDPTLSGSGFTFHGGTGIAANDSAFVVKGAFGNQAAFLQNAGTISTTFTVANSQSYAINFWDEGRNSQNGPNTFTVSLSGGVYASPMLLGTYFPTNLNSFKLEETNSLILKTGTNYTVTFTGLSQPAGDVTSFIDNVSVAAVPLPPAAIAGVGLLGGIAVIRKRRSLLNLI